MSLDHLTLAIGVLAAQLVGSVVRIPGAMTFADLSIPNRAVRRQDHGVRTLGAVALPGYPVTLDRTSHDGHSHEMAAKQTASMTAKRANSIRSFLRALRNSSFIPGKSSGLSLTPSSSSPPAPCPARRGPRGRHVPSRHASQSGTPCEPDTRARP
jgi:hypothetical protein